MEANTKLDEELSKIAQPSLVYVVKWSVEVKKVFSSETMAKAYAWDLMEEMGGYENLVSVEATEMEIGEELN